MELRHQKISTSNPTLNTLISELAEECQNVIALVNQFQLNNLTDKQKVEILAELLASTIHLNTHCGENFQDLISQELENLSDQA